VTSRPTPDGAAAPRPLVGRLLQWTLGIALCSAGVWLSIQAALGLSPWDVLHAGIGHRVGIPFGTVVALVGLVVVALAAALRVRPTAGTLVNVVVVGVVLNHLLVTGWLDGLAREPVGVRVAVLLAAVTVLGLGIALYLGAGFGAGPRDSLMVAAHHHGMPIGLSRCLVEVSVLLGGWHPPPPPSRRAGHRPL